MSGKCKVRNLAKDNQVVEAIELSTGAGRQLFSEQEKQIGDYLDLARLDLTQTNQAAAHQYENTRLLLIVATAFSLIVGAGAAFWMALSISRGLDRAGVLARAVAGGDLTQTATITSRDKIGDITTHINTMVERLRAVVTDALGAADNVSSGSQELSASLEELSQGATEQASAAEEASASMEQMAANIKQNADNAGQTEKIARRSATDAQKSGDAVGSAVHAMQTIAEKITIVQEIAQQTDLLARKFSRQISRTVYSPSPVLRQI